MKKVLCVMLTILTITAASSATAFAHGGRRVYNNYGGCGGYRGLGWNGTQTYQQLCWIDECEIDDSHIHGVCAITDCGLLGLHEHDGEYYLDANYGTWNGCHGGNYR